MCCCFFNNTSVATKQAMQQLLSLSWNWKSNGQSQAITEWIENCFGMLGLFKYHREDLILYLPSLSSWFYWGQQCNGDSYESDSKWEWRGLKPTLEPEQWWHPRKIWELLWDARGLSIHTPRPCHTHTPIYPPQICTLSCMTSECTFSLLYPTALRAKSNWDSPILCQ